MIKLIAEHPNTSNFENNIHITLLEVDNDNNEKVLFTTDGNGDDFEIETKEYPYGTGSLYYNVHLSLPVDIIEVRNC